MKGTAATVLENLDVGDVKTVWAASYFVDHVYGRFIKTILCTILKDGLGLIFEWLPYGRQGHTFL